MSKVRFRKVVAAVSDPNAAIRKRIRLNSAERRRREEERIRWHREHRYPGDWVYEYFGGNGVEFGHGMGFLECGSQKLHHAHGADGFLPFYCFLDFPMSKAAGSGLARTMTLAEGHVKCDFRYKEGREIYPEWPPPVL